MGQSERAIQQLGTLFQGVVSLSGSNGQWEKLARRWWCEDNDLCEVPLQWSDRLLARP